VNWLDVVLAIIFVLSVSSGLWKGLARVGIGLLATILALFCAVWCYGTVAYYFLPYVSHKGIASFLGFVSIFFGIILLGAIAGRLLTALLKWAGFSWLNRLSGAVFGALRAYVISIGLVLALMAFTPHPPPQSVAHSRFAPFVIRGARVCARMAPHEVRENVWESYKKLREIQAELLKMHKDQPQSSEKTF